MIENVANEESQTVTADALYIFIGARPFTEWLSQDLITDDKGFVETGRDLKAYDRFSKIWKLERDPYSSGNLVARYLRGG